MVKRMRSLESPFQSLYNSWKGVISVCGSTATCTGAPASNARPSTTTRWRPRETSISKPSKPGDSSRSRSSHCCVSPSW
ncbi:hypothetical protein AVEN_206618-1 [Araneus ventricosus]|uniref:Uncharacterized protein n=1 Tax=Araneus ventricosus TaxID=182803 RepID=A0A4Y2QXB8_ARAVE|nr:hypothetical protein AVEN_206618-1 [Araneus ventricosus]